MALYVPPGELVPAGLTTLKDYALRTGRPVDQINEDEMHSGWPDFPGRLGRVRREGQWPGESLYRGEELDGFFKAHPLVFLPVLADPLPAGMTTLDRYADQARRPAALHWGRRPGVSGHAVCTRAGSV
jgi:hypothetical protein